MNTTIRCNLWDQMPNEEIQKTAISWNLGTPGVYSCIDSKRQAAIISQKFSFLETPQVSDYAILSTSHSWSICFQFSREKRFFATPIACVQLSVQLCFFLVTLLMILYERQLLWRLKLTLISRKGTAKSISISSVERNMLANSTMLSQLNEWLMLEISSKARGMD